MISSECGAAAYMFGSIGFSAISHTIYFPNTVSLRVIVPKLRSDFDSLPGPIRTGVRG